MRIAVFFCFILYFTSYAQNNEGKLSGHITNKSISEPLANANIIALPGDQGTVSDSLGNFSLILPFGTYKIKVSYIGFKSEEKTVTLSEHNSSIKLIIKLEPKIISQQEVFVIGKKEIFSPATQILQKQDIIRMPTIYSDVLQSVKILAGVTSNNELTSAYNVRGGNYNENLIYLDGFEIYRPFLITRGIEENQSIVNEDLVGHLNFNGGTFSAQLGDKMSSALEITYKDNFDTTLSGVARAGILNSGVTLFKRIDKLNLAGAVRYSYPKLFVSTLQTKGDYNPTYFDVQLLGNYRFSGNSSMQLLFINALNKFQLTPKDWTGNFQTGLFDVKQVLLKYSGSNEYSFNTRLLGFKYNKRLFTNEGFSILGSVYSTREKDFQNLTSSIYYSNDAYNAAQTERYLKTRYKYTDDKLNMDIYELKSIFNLNTSVHKIEAGADVKLYKFNTLVDESMHESGADSVLEMPYNINLSQNVTFPSFSGYVQDVINFNKKFQIEAGVRVLRYNFSNETDVSPRMSLNYFYSHSSKLNFSAGFYYQPPFYYEVGNKIIENSTTDLKSQRSINFMLSWETGTENNSKYMVDIFYKKQNNLIPYYIDRLQLVYGDANNYEGYERGIDFQYEGDLVPGIKSWIGYSYLDTGERPKESNLPYTRTLLGQRHTLKIFLQDRVKKHPNFQAHVRFLFGSGFLYHPRISVKDPSTNTYYIKIDYSHSRVIPFYFRIDMGLSNKFDLGKDANLMVTVELFNVFNKNNIETYNWYSVLPQTVQPVGIPVMLSGRFLSLEAEMNF